MRPRTTASAFCSPASRSPKRFSSASRTAPFTSAVSAASGVSLSNGRIATVLTLGSPPPEKRYRQATSPSVAALAAATPQCRRNDHRRIHPHHGKLKARRALREIDARAGGPPPPPPPPPLARPPARPAPPPPPPPPPRH